MKKNAGLVIVMTFAVFSLAAMASMVFGLRVTCACVDPDVVIGWEMDRTKDAVIAFEAENKRMPTFVELQEINDTPSSLMGITALHDGTQPDRSKEGVYYTLTESSYEIEGYVEAHRTLTLPFMSSSGMIKVDAVTVKTFE